ncbi:helicase associated domain-containing protein [Streptomyces sp. NBC_01077]|uniref:helicase associated domain-containing protein n=1 Tax=Streptomyces sp. NBC_01077 TaxID=2903746 RepID=UPI0038656A80
MLDKPIGQWLSWPAQWQRHFAALRGLVRDEEGPDQVMPGFTVHGMDVGKWLVRQQTPGVWAALNEGQRERLVGLGVVPPAPWWRRGVPAEPSTAPMSAFERGVAALAQYAHASFEVRNPVDVISFGESAVADEGTGDGCEGEEVLCFAFVASVESAAAGEPGHGALDGPSAAAQSL